MVENIECDVVDNYNLAWRPIVFINERCQYARKMGASNLPKEISRVIFCSLSNSRPPPKIIFIKF